MPKQNSCQVFINFTCRRFCFCVSLTAVVIENKRINLGGRIVSVGSWAIGPLHQILSFIPKLLFALLSLFLIIISIICKNLHNLHNQLNNIMQKIVPTTFYQIYQTTHLSTCWFPFASPSWQHNHFVCFAREHDFNYI